MAEHPETGERGPRTVTHVRVHGDALVDFRIADDVVTTTEDHPFWNATDGTWQGPEEFDAGDRVLTADGNLLVTGGLVASSWHTGSAYNLTVQGIHTYYVVVADEAVLVHNCPGDGAPRTNTAQNKQFDDAIRVAERQLGRTLTRDERNLVHHETSGQNYGFHDIVDEVLGQFGGAG